jgi:hypothetical protein
MLLSYGHDVSRISIAARDDGHMAKVFWLTQLYAAPVFLTWMLLDIYRTDPEYFWRRITSRF